MKKIKNKVYTPEFLAKREHLNTLLFQSRGVIMKDKTDKIQNRQTKKLEESKALKGIYEGL